MPSARPARWWSSISRPRCATLMIALVVLIGLVAGSATAGITTTQRCVKDKLKAVGKHAKLIGKCYSKVASNGALVTFAACETKVTQKTLDAFDKVEFKIAIQGGSCPATTDELWLTGPQAWLKNLVDTTLFPPHNVLPSKCVARKVKALGKYADALAKCEAKHYLKPDAVKYVSCIAKADLKTTKQFVKADEQGPCASDPIGDILAALKAIPVEQLEIIRFGASRLILAPTNGTFTNAPDVLVVGAVPGGEVPATLTVNGMSVLPLDPLLGFSANVSMDTAKIFNPLVAELTAPDGDVRRDRVTVVAGDGVTTGFVLDGERSPQSLAMRFTDDGLSQVEPIVSTLAADGLDIGTLLIEQNPILDDECVVNPGCLYSATVNITEVDFQDFSLTLDALASGSTQVSVGISDFFVGIDLHVHDLVAVSFNCLLEISTSTADITGMFDMVPDAANPSKVDVNQIGDVSVVLGGFQSEFISGICDDPLIGDIIQAFIGNTLEDLVQDGFSENLADPDGPGPLDSSIAAGIEAALDGIDIAGPFGQGIGANLDAEFFAITEDTNGISFNVDSAITASLPDPAAPDLLASYTVMEPFPTYGPVTPVLGQPYGMALGISTSAFNQLMKAQIESGLLRVDITEFDFGLGPVPLTAGLLTSFIPELGQFDPAEPVVMEARPALAPIVTGAPGPLGELAEMKIAHLLLSVRLPNLGTLVVDLAIDVDLGINLTFVDGALGFSFGAPAASDVTIDVLENPFETDEVALKTFLATVLPFAFPSLAGALDSFPLPSFLGLVLEPIEISRAGEFMTIFADLGTDPAADVLANVVLTDLSSGDVEKDDPGDVHQWRHRITHSAGGTVIDAHLQGMLGADACCTFEDETLNVTAHYQLSFDVASDENWELHVDHDILGAFSLLDEKVALEDAGGDVSITAVSATYSVNGGAAQSFGFTPDVTSVVHTLYGGEGDTDQEFMGNAATIIAGSGTASVVLDFDFDLHAKSDSNLFFPAAGGDEVAIRLGRTDTIDDGFTAGQYPSGHSSLANRSVDTDGHFVHVDLVVVP